MADWWLAGWLDGGWLACYRTADWKTGTGKKRYPFWGQKKVSLPGWVSLPSSGVDFTLSQWSMD